MSEKPRSSGIKQLFFNLAPLLYSNIQLLHIKININVNPRLSVI